MLRGWGKVISLWQLQRSKLAPTCQKPIWLLRTEVAIRLRTCYKVQEEADDFQDLRSLPFADGSPLLLLFVTLITGHCRHAVHTIHNVSCSQYFSKGCCRACPNPRGVLNPPLLATHLLLFIVLQILDIIKKHPAVSVQESLAAAFDPSNIDAQQNEGQASQLHHHQQPSQPSQPSTQLQHRPLHADVAIMKQALEVL